MDKDHAFEESMVTLVTKMYFSLKYNVFYSVTLSMTADIERRYQKKSQLEYIM